MAAHRLGQVEPYLSVGEVLSKPSTVRPELFGSETCRRDPSTSSGRVAQGRTARGRGQPQMACYGASAAVFTGWAMRLKFPSVPCLGENTLKFSLIYRIKPIFTPEPSL